MWDLEVEAFEDVDGWSGWVTETEVLESDGSACGGHGLADRGRDSGMAVLEFEEAGGGAYAFHKFRVEGREAEEGGAGEDGVHEEGGEVANGDGAGLDHAAADVEDGENGHVAHEAGLSEC